MKDTGKWTPEKAIDIITDPVHAFGFQIEPELEAITTKEFIQAFNYYAPEWFWSLPTEKKASLYRSFYDFLEQHGLIKILNSEVPTLISIDMWIEAQEKMSVELRRKKMSKKFLYIVGVARVFFEVAVTADND